jgi:multidrug resistance efflux pump
MVGQVVKEGDLIAKVYEMKTVEVETPVSEKDIADIKVGDKVALKARAFPEKTLFGTVTSVGATAQTGQTVATAGTSTAGTSSTSARSASPAPTFLVMTRIANDDLLLKPGMSGMVKIHCGDRCLFDLLARRVARTVKVEFWSWW